MGMLGLLHVGEPCNGCERLSKEYYEVTKTQVVRDERLSRGWMDASLEDMGLVEWDCLVSKELRVRRAGELGECEAQGQMSWGAQGA